MYAAGDEGAGTTVAVYELEGNFPADITAYQSCFGTDASVSYDPVDGGGGRPNANNEDGLETELDIENLIGLAPKVNVVVYQGPNTAQGGLATYEAIISADTAKVIQTSWGECEPDLGNATARAEATVFAEAAVQGQTVVAAAGDSGAQDCYGDATAQDTATTVDDPASQPFVTGVGGTTLSSTSPRSETVWNDGAASLVTGGGAGGGGDSSFWTMPGYQSSAPSSLGVINSQSSSSDCPASGTYCREVPDVSADAAIDTGYLVYWDGNGENSDSNAWISVAGTSAAAPVWAALFALADEESTCSTPIGFANPGLYSAAASNYAGDFYDVTSGNNDLLGASGSLHGEHRIRPGERPWNADCIDAGPCAVLPDAPDAHESRRAEDRRRKRHVVAAEGERERRHICRQRAPPRAGAQRVDRADLGQADDRSDLHGQGHGCRPRQSRRLNAVHVDGRGVQAHARDPCRTDRASQARGPAPSSRERQPRQRSHVQGERPTFGSDPVERGGADLGNAEEGWQVHG